MVVVAVGKEDTVEPAFDAPRDEGRRGSGRAVSVRPDAGIDKDPGAPSLHKDGRAADLIAPAQHLHAKAPVRAGVSHRLVRGGLCRRRKGRLAMTVSGGGCSAARSVVPWLAGSRTGGASGGEPLRNML